MNYQEVHQCIRDAKGEGEAEWAKVWMQEAQVLATLALAEQQRVANLIALNEHREDTGSPDLDAVCPMLKEDVRVALGL